ncbi:MAG: sulfite exporter TauE/SafE family protein [Gammaproteobacteria bacterium]|nr:sulfite exporter TauE/SafE family protein [Gammaproteobacteria bacterium]
MDPLFTLAGLLVGICVGLTGVGGGALMTPILVLFFGIPPALAVGTDLAYAAFTKMSGVLFHGLRKNIQWRIVGRLALGSIPSSLLTIWALDGIAGNQLAEQIMTITLSITLVVTSVVLVLKEKIQMRSANKGSRLLWIRTQRRYLLTLLGAVLGVVVTLSSIGAGALTAALLFLLYPRMKTVMVVGTDLAHAVPLAAIAGLGHFQLGNVDTTLLGSLLLGSIPGTALGSHLAQHISEVAMRRGLAGILFFTGLKFVF